MARKPKKQTNEGSSPLPLTPISEETITETYEASPEEPISFSEYVSTTPLRSFGSIEGEIYQAMNYALSEIERCNDYIYAKADLDRRFTVYRDELYEYRYKIRQLSLLKDYPYIDYNLMPPKPDFIPDV